MKISELIKKIREEHNYSFGEMANRIGFSKGMNYIKAVPFYKVNEQILNFENKNVSLYVEAYKQESQRAW